VKKLSSRIAVFASGSGTNAENLIRYFSDSEKGTVSLVLSNNPLAGVIQRAKQSGVPVFVFNRKEFNESDEVILKLAEYKIDFIVLAGFLWLVPENLIRAFENKIVNIHPALLPGYGGKGFYGSNVHRAVISSGTIISGITIHNVNRQFDEGEIIFQAACHVSRTDTVESLSKKIHQLEYAWFPVVVEKIISKTDEMNISAYTNSLNR
jgi:phosphoribosylglycinamide formyltransferase-1